LRSPTATTLFILLWRTLSNLVGTPATATLLRRSLKRVEAQHPRLAGVNIARAEHDYVFTLPPEWSEPSDTSLEELRVLYTALCALSQQLTGSVILRRLEALSELAILRTPSHEDQKP
jgi:ATP phosphoribosyltransferase